MKQIVDECQDTGTQQPRQDTNTEHEPGHGTRSLHDEAKKSSKGHCRRASLSLGKEIGCTHLNYVGQMGWLVLIILNKEGQEVLNHLFNMWCSQEEPRIGGGNLHRLASLASKLRPGMSGVRHCLSDVPI